MVIYHRSNQVFFLPEFRLPTEAEWEYAAYGQIGDQWLDENQNTKKVNTLGMVERLEAQRGGMLVSFKQTLKEVGVIMLV